MMVVALGVVTWHSYSPLSSGEASWMRTAHLKADRFLKTLRIVFAEHNRWDSIKIMG